MRVAIILGFGLSTKRLRPFVRNTDVGWQVGLPVSSSEVDAILIFGGDGTVHRHLAQLCALQLPVLVVPCGSGNDFARSLKLRCVGDAVDAWHRFYSRQDNVRQIDLGMISQFAPDAAGDPSTAVGESRPPGRYFCSVGGVGLDVEIAGRANRLPRWVRRRGGYLLSLLPALLGFEPLAVTVRTSQPDPSVGFATSHEGRAVVVAFANGPAYGGGIRIAPHAQLDDGKLDICVVGKIGKVRVLRLFPSVYSGRHLRIPEVKYFQAGCLRLETEHPMEVYADGEYVCRTPVEVSVNSAALRVIVGRFGSGG